MYAIYLFAIAYTGVLSNQHLFVFLVLIAIWIWLRPREKSILWKRALLVGFLLAIANIIRPEAILILAAIFFWEILKIAKKEDIKKCAIEMICLLGIFTSIICIASFAIKKTGINPSGLENKNILWKFVCGSDYEVGGGYSIRGEAFTEDPEAEKQFIIQNYTSLSPTDWVIFLKKKIQNFWTNDSYGWASENVGDEKEILPGIQVSGESLIQIVKVLDGMGYILIFFFALQAMAKARKENVLQLPPNFLMILLLFHFLIYLVIETQTRYAYLSRILLFILAMDGLKIWKEEKLGENYLKRIMDFVEKIKNKKKAIEKRL